MALRGGGERTSALALLLGDVLAAHARGDLPPVPHLEEPRALHARGGPYGGPHLLPGVPRAADRLAHEPQEHPQEEAQALRSSLPLPEGPSPPPAPLPPQLPPSAEEGGPSCGWTKKPSAGAHL